MIRKYYRVITITIEKIIIGNTQLAHDIPETSPEGSLKVLTSGTCKGPSGYSQGTKYKNWSFYRKNVFLEVISLFTYLLLFFLQEEKIFKSSKRGHLRDVYGNQLRDVHETKWWDVLKMSVGRRSNMFFKLNSQTH